MEAEWFPKSAFVIDLSAEIVCNPKAFLLKREYMGCLPSSPFIQMTATINIPSKDTLLKPVSRPLTLWEGSQRTSGSLLRLMRSIQVSQTVSALCLCHHSTYHNQGHRYRNSQVLEVDWFVV